MNDSVGDTFRSYNAFKKALRSEFGVPCPKCRELQPRRDPTILLPQQRCKVDKYVDPRPRLTEAEKQAAAMKHGVDYWEPIKRNQ